MTDTTESLDGARLLSPSTRRTYTADWALFTDWCAATGTVALPADPHTVLAFLADCPGAPASLRRRVAAIDHHHAGAGYPRPGQSVVVRAALGRRTGAPGTGRGRAPRPAFTLGAYLSARKPRPGTYSKHGPSQPISPRLGRP